MKIIETVPDLCPDSGGPSYTVPALCDVLAKRDIEVKIVAGHFSGEQRMRCDIPFSDVEFVRGVQVKNSRIRYVPNFDKVIEKHLNSNTPTIIHSNGLWAQPSIVSAIVAQQQHIPHVISLRGMLSPWALNHKALKKRAAWHLYQKDILAHATAVHATSTTEADEFRSLGFSTPVSIIPNGVDIQSIASTETPSNKRRRQVLFLSRVHPKKGLDMLVDAWTSIAGQGWKCIIAGPDEEGYANLIQRQIRNAQLDDEIEMVGAVYDDARRKLFLESSLFVLPTHSENFGVVVAEALSCGIPVVTTHGAPWKELTTHRCGWWIPPNTHALSKSLVEAIRTPVSELEQMGIRGRALVLEKYTWEQIATRFIELFNSICQ